MKHFILVAALFLGLSGAYAQEAAPPASRPDPMGSLLEVMRDETLRNQLIREIEDSRARAGQADSAPAAPAQSDQPAEAAQAEEDVFSRGGLVTSVMAWLRELGGRLPHAALGAPIDVKLRQAEAQIESRLSAAGPTESARTLGLFWIPGWLIGTVAALTTLVYVRRRIRSRITGPAPMSRVAGQAALRGGMGLLPLVACLAVAGAWVGWMGFSEQSSIVFLTLTMPFVIALATSEFTSSLLLLLAPTKGWKLVAYAQRRLAPLVGLLVGVATGASVMAIPELRSMIGTATADIADLLLDLLVPLIALYIIATNRRVVRALIVRGHVRGDKTTSLDRAIHWVGRHWHQLGIVFVVLNILARLFGAETGSFLTQSFLSVGVIVLALFLSAVMRRAGEERKKRFAATRRQGLGGAVFNRLKSVLVACLQAAIAVIAVIACLGLWGVDAAGWAASSAGASVLGPLFSIGIVVFTTWTLWVVLDAWIERALAPDHGAHGRQRSARVMTLLPLLRNFAFVALSVLTVMGVLSNLGINIAPLIAGAGVVGLAIGFGSQQLVQDVITGMFILLEDTIAIGDVVDTGGRIGTVEALTIRTVKIRDGDGALHSIPFSTIKALKNSSRGFGVYTASVTLDFDADVERAIEIMKSAGDEVRKNPKFSQRIIGPFDVAGIDHIGLDGVVVKGTVKTLPLQQYGVGTELNRRIRESLQKAGISVARRTPAQFAGAEAL